MAQMWLLLIWWLKNTPSATKIGTGGDGAHDDACYTTTSSSASAKTTSLAQVNGSDSRRLTKAISKLRRRCGRRRKTVAFQCRYDPLSYALNFDTSSPSEEDYYYQFCAFSSRFVANPNQTPAGPAPAPLQTFDLLTN